VGFWYFRKRINKKRINRIERRYNKLNIRQYIKWLNIRYYSRSKWKKQDNEWV
jgi:hypothetical protein